MGRLPRLQRDQILAVARSVFTERGFDASTLAEIAGPLEVTPAAILRHFDSKQDLFSAAMSSRFDELAHADPQELRMLRDRPRPEETAASRARVTQAERLRDSLSKQRLFAPLSQAPFTLSISGQAIR